MYFYGSAKTYDEAQAILKGVKEKGFKNAFIVLFNGEKLVE
jgi:N-acetylmuramoyl-L-alanine amidase